MFRTMANKSQLSLTAITRFDRNRGGPVSDRNRDLYEAAGAADATGWSEQFRSGICDRRSPAASRCTVTRNYLTEGK
jgi:hypothetical protein